MNYLIVIPDETLPVPRIANSSDPAVLRAVLQNNQDKLPVKTILRLRELPVYGLPDVIFTPVFMVSQLFYICVRIYHPYLKVIPIRLLYPAGIAQYYILLLEEEGEKESSPDYTQHIYRILVDNKIRLKISLDLAESLLRRGAFGFSLMDGKEG